MYRALTKPAVLALFLLLLTCCSSYKQGILFRTQGSKLTPVQKDLHLTEKNYVIQPNDQLNLQVYANNGERVIDPNGELQREQGTAPSGSANQRNDAAYFVDQKGVVKFPMVGSVPLVGFTLREAELLLQKEYDKYYKECFVVLAFQNKRVTVLGSTGGQVIPLTNENTRLAEVLALAKGVSNASKAKSIRVLRGDQSFLIDFSTIDGFQKGNLIVESGDVIYVEPVVRPFFEGFRDASPIVSIVLGLSTLTIVIINSLSK